MKRDSILASVTGLFDSSTWAGKQGGAPRAALAAGRYAADAPRLQQNHVFSQSIPEHLHGAARPRGRGRAGNRRRPGGLSPPRRFSHLLRHGRRRGHAAVPRAASRRGSAGRESAGHGRLDVLRAIRDEGQTPVIIVTALADDVDKLGLPGRGRLRRQTLQSRRGRGAPAGRAAARGGACERRAHPRRRHRDRRAGPRRGRACGRRALRAAATDADRVPPAGLPGIPAAALLLARIPDRALPAGKRRA